MTAKHLGRAVHDLLDGRLGASASAEAMAHLAECEECDARFRELRDARERLNSSDVGIDMAFAQALLDRERMATIAAKEDPHHARAVRPPDRRPVYLVLGSLVAIAGGVGVAYAAGAPQTVTVETASGETPGAAAVAYIGPQEVASDAQLSAWSCPDWHESGLDPVYAEVKEMPNGTDQLFLALVSGLDRVLVTEQHGQLAPAWGDVPTVQQGDQVFHVIHGTPTSLVWEAGDLVFTASCDCEVSTLVDVATAFPADDEPGVVDRISAGLGQLVDAIIGSD